MRKIINTLAALALSFASTAALAEESDYYTLEEIPIPEGIVLEAGGIDMLPSGKLVVSTRRGDIYTVSNPLAKDTADCEFKLFAGGLHEVLGVHQKDGYLYVTQRCEVSRLKDVDNDGRADLFETISDGWEINGDYHEYAFGSNFDKDGNIWVVLCLTGSFDSNSQYRGWCLRITPDGKVIPTCSGIRSPGGIGFNCNGDVFYTDNQGPWNGACSLKHLKPGTFQGHPGGFKWYKDAADVLGEAPKEPKSNSRMMVEAKQIPQLEPPAIYFPYNKMGQSAAGFVCDSTGGKFGPFEGQMFVCDQTHSTVMRVALEKVNGHYQGACFPFRAGFGSGSISIYMTPNGEMFVGGTNRGWGSRGPKNFALDRVKWTGKTPFEIHSVKAEKDGFTFKFTEPVDPTTAKSPESYQVETFCYIYQANYGSPEVDQTKPTIKDVTVAADGLSARVTLDQLQEGHIHQFKLSGVRNKAGQHLEHTEAYYTLNYLPQ